MFLINKKTYITLILSFFLLSLSFPLLTQSQDSGRNLSNAFGENSVLDETSKEAGYKTGEGQEEMLTTIIGQSLNIFLSLLGVVFMILVIIAGYKWMTAAGNEEQVTQAKSYLKYAIIGLFVISLAWGTWALMRPIIDTF